MFLLLPQKQLINNTLHREMNVSVYGNKNKLQVTQYLTLQGCTKFPNMNRL